MRIVKALITKALREIFSQITDKKIPVSLEIPSDLSHGDYTTTVALQVFKRINVPFSSPFSLAQEVAKQLEEFSLKGIEKVEAVKPGFINFWVSKEELLRNLELQRSLKSLTGGDSLSGKKIMVEFADPNPFKEFHIGHLYSTIVGESICRLLESQGAEVRRVTYQGDVGLHVAKSIWGIMQKLEIAQKQPDGWLTINHGEATKKLKDVEKKEKNKRATFLGEAYALGARKYEEDGVVKNQIHTLNKKIYFREDPIINEIYDKGRQWSIDYFEGIYQRLGSTFTKNYFESEAGKKGIEIVRQHIKDGIFEEHSGAVVFRGEKYGLHTRVFINSLGLPTYEAKELGLAPAKYKDYHYDQSLIITGNEVNEYFNVLLTVLSLIDADLAAKTKHIAHGMVRLPQGKMSSRTGNVLTGEWLLEEAIKRAGILTKAKNVLSGADASVHVPEQVAIGAVKYAFLKNRIGADIAFSFDESVSFEGNSGPYIQYTYARTQSILSQPLAQEEKMDEINHDELLLLRKLYQFPLLVGHAAATYAPHGICGYLFDLAQAFNNYYQKYRIREVSFRLSLTAAVGNVLALGLTFLGIAAPKRM